MATRTAGDDGPAPSAADDVRGVASRSADGSLAPWGLPEQLAFETLLFDLSATFIDLAPGEVEGCIASALERAARFLDADRSTFLESSDPASRLVSVATWVAPGFTPFRMGDVSAFGWVMSQIRSGRTILLSNLPHDLPAEVTDAERRHVLDTGMRAMLAVPVRVGGRIFGALSFGCFRGPRSWPARFAPRVQVLGEIFANALVRERAVGEIHRLTERLEAENSVLREELAGMHGFEDLVGRSAPWRRVLEQIGHVAATDATVLVLGETGTGKELVAHAIHARSARKDRAFIPVNCAAIPSTLIESEFFGHEKGAFTGALARKLGRFELADGGTIFLDEIGDLAPELQAKLLRVLQHGELERLGSTRTQRVDVRVIAATNRDLERAMAAGHFRPDLYYRLNVFPIALPPLRERSEDVPLLAWYFVTRRQAKLGKRIERIPAATMDALARHHWPGNVRELENVIERALIVSPGDTLVVDATMLSPGLGASVPTASGPAGATRRTLEEHEREHIERTLAACGGRVTGRDNAADRLGINPSTLRSRMKKLGIR